VPLLSQINPFHTQLFFKTYCNIFHPSKARSPTWLSVNSTKFVWLSLLARITSHDALHNKMMSPCCYLRCLRSWCRPQHPNVLTPIFCPCSESPRVPHLYKTGTIVVLFMLLGSKQEDRWFWTEWLQTIPEFNLLSLCTQFSCILFFITSNIWTVVCFQRIYLLSMILYFIFGSYLTYTVCP